MRITPQSGTSPKIESRVSLSQFISTCRITRCSSRRMMWPSQFHRLSLACKATSSAGLQASSAIVRAVILDRIFDTVLFCLRRACADSFQASHSYRRVDVTDAFKSRRRRPFGSLEAVRSGLRSANLDQAIAIRWLTAASESRSLDCITPRYLKWRTFESSASPSWTFSSSSCSAFFFTSFTSVSAADPARDGSLLDCDWLYDF